MIKKEFLNLNQSLSSDKNVYQGIWKFWVNGNGGPKRIWNQAPWSPLWYRFFSKVVVTIPRRFQMIKKEFLNLNQSLSSDKNGYQGIWKFWVNGMGRPKWFENFGSTVRGPQRIWNQALIFFKSCCNYPETFSYDQKGVSELKPITFIW